ncbi:MAG: hypothetical protein M1814_002993 [Vezdaea aestivalis]|nr:MAG: hypothetical protein M1814_002993 [Vezdaea aestivalis]
MSTSPTGTHRPTAPLSPPSPQLDSLKKNGLPQAVKTVANHPQTPTSPSSMSTPSNRHASPHSLPQTSQPINNDSSPSAVPMSAQNSQQPITNPSYAMPTPASSVAGNPTTAKDGEAMSRSMSTNTTDGFASTSVKRSREEDTEVECSEKRRKTNHNRIDEEQTAIEGDEMDVEVAQAPTSVILGPEWMREPVENPYLVCIQPHPMTRPHPSIDVITQYGLKRLADTVARTLPNGEKNRLRKTYKGKITDANVSGRNKEVKHPEGEPGSMPELMMWPDEEWQIQKASGIDIEKGIPDSALAKLSRAFKMEAGSMPDFDDSIFGLFDDPTPLPAVATSAAPLQSMRSNAQSAANGNSEPARLRRTGTKRSYVEGSFEGYGEGFVDDEVDRDGYDSGGSGGRGVAGPSKRKRRRVSLSR